jgi:hypothetical protein
METTKVSGRERECGERWGKGKKERRERERVHLLWQCYHMFSMAINPLD